MLRDVKLHPFEIRWFTFRSNLWCHRIAGSLFPMIRHSFRYDHVLRKWVKHLLCFYLPLAYPGNICNILPLFNFFYSSLLALLFQRKVWRLYPYYPNVANSCGHTCMNEFILMLGSVDALIPSAITPGSFRIWRYQSSFSLGVAHILPPFR